jgi:hypothetical protein
LPPYQSNDNPSHCFRMDQTCFVKMQSLQRCVGVSGSLYISKPNRVQSLVQQTKQTNLSKSIIKQLPRSVQPVVYVQSTRRVYPKPNPCRMRRWREREKKTRSGRPTLSRPVAPARPARQPCHAKVSGTTGWGPTRATQDPINGLHYGGTSCRASASGAIVWCCRASRATRYRDQKGYI